MKEIELSQGKVALVSSEDYDNLVQYKWHARRDRNGWYAGRTIRLEDGKRVLLSMSTAIMGEKGIDHINGNGLDNRKENLRLATNYQNSMNQKRAKNNTSGYKGVSWRKDVGRWVARIRVDGKIIHLGFSDSLVQAACWYDDAAIKHFGEFAKLNFPKKEIFRG